MAFHQKGRQITMLDSFSVSLGKAVTILLGKGMGVRWWLRGEGGELCPWQIGLLGCDPITSFDTSIKSTAPALYSKQLQHNTHFSSISWLCMKL